MNRFTLVSNLRNMTLFKRKAVIITYPFTMRITEKKLLLRMKSLTEFIIKEEPINEKRVTFLSLNCLIDCVS